MAKVLGRSKSMRLKSSTRDMQHANPSMPSLDMCRKGIDRKPPSITSRADSVTRPRTSSGEPNKDHSRSPHLKHVPIMINNSGGFDFTQHSPAYDGSDSKAASAIGMALGSPTQSSSPAVFSPQLSEKGSQFRGVPQGLSQGSTTTSINSDVPDAPQPKPKLSRWKSIFGRKNSDRSQQQPKQSQPFYQAQPVVSQHTPHLENQADVASIFRSPSPSIVASPIMSDGDEERFRSRSISRHIQDTPIRMSSATSQTVPIVLDPSSPPAQPIVAPRSRQTSRTPRREMPERQVPKLTVSNDSAPFSPSSAPLLDIDIPNIEMERYSVMFSSLLGTGLDFSTAQNPIPSNSSLLVRRQGSNAEKKVTPLNESALNKNTHPRPQRRVTSPTLKSTPLSLFPPPSPAESRPSLERAGTLNRPRPLQRSRTLPPHRPSPSSKSFQSDDAYSEEPSTAGLSAGPSTAGFTDDGDSRLPRPSYEEDRETMALQSLRKNNVWKPELEEPSWEILNPAKPPPRTSSRGNTSTMRIVEATPSAHVGIARTVSVSRAVRTPTRPKPSTTGSPERLVTRQTLTPTLVELKNRKSQRVQLVDA